MFIKINEMSIEREELQVKVEKYQFGEKKSWLRKKK